MINWLHARIHRPEKGWDPVPAAHAAEYASVEWDYGAQSGLLDQVEEWVGGLAGKSVIDIGGGPGQYSVALARRGARVTWHDVSGRYRTIAGERAAQAGVEVRFSIGYMDEAPDTLNEQFDLVFNRICWNYGRGDRSFARCLWRLMKPGGSAYIDTTPDIFKYDELGWSARARIGLNRACGWKIGHPFPPHGRIARIFAQMPLERMLVDYSSPLNDRIFLRKSGAGR
ncbi:MAG: methyltransferase domain-containing protein [Steroidobacteraceae bacterium]